LTSGDIRIEAVARIETSVVRHDRGLRLVEMTDVVLGRILRAALIEERSHAVFEVGGAVAFADDVVLMEDVTKEMSVIELVNHRLLDLRARASNQFGSLRLSATSSATMSSTSSLWMAR
jgi:hypothetical protein